MLTAVKVKKAPIKDKQYKLSDAGGLYLLVHPNGSKYWRYKYRFAGKEKTLALGTLAELSLAEVRERHQEARKLLKGGIDPSKQKKVEKIQRQCAAENSFENVARHWHETKTKAKDWDSKHAQKIWRSLELHIFPHVGSLPITEIKPREVLYAIRKIEQNGTTEVSHRVLQRVSAVFQYAICADLAEYNPAADLKGALVAHKTKHFPSITADELPEFFRQLDTARTSLLNKLAIKLLACTFLRQCELRRARWEEVDFNQQVWCIPAEHTKMKRADHIVPLATQALHLLGEVKKITGDSEYLFPTQNRQKNPIMSEGTITRVLKDMGYKDKMVGHGFRALATTTLNEAGFDTDVVERQMQHQEANKVRAAYHRAQYMEQRTEMMQWWADYLEKLGLDAETKLVKKNVSKKAA